MEPAGCVTKLERSHLAKAPGSLHLREALDRRSEIRGPKESPL